MSYRWSNGDVRCSSSVTDPNDERYCAPENINVDVPILGMPYRVMVNYFKGSRATHPTVNIYCGSALRGSFGTDPFVTLQHSGSNGAESDNWYVADVVFYEAECGIDCRVYPLDPFGTNIVRGVDVYVPFGPPWSCAYDAAMGACIE